jgi:hypothetical protein
MPDLIYTGTLRIASNDPNSPRDIALRATQSTFLAPVEVVSYEGNITIYGITEYGDLSDPPRKYRNQIGNYGAVMRWQVNALPNDLQLMIVNMFDRTAFNDAGTKFDQMSYGQFAGNAGNQPAFPAYTTIPLGTPDCLAEGGTGTSGGALVDTYEDYPPPAAWALDWFGTWTREKRQKLHPYDQWQIATRENASSPQGFLMSQPIGSTTNPRNRTNIRIIAIRQAGGHWAIYGRWDMGQPPVGFGPVSSLYIEADTGDRELTADSDSYLIGQLQAGPGSGRVYRYFLLNLPADTSFRFYLNIAGEPDGQFPKDWEAEDADMTNEELLEGGIRQHFYLPDDVLTGANLRDEAYSEHLTVQDNPIDALIADGGTLVGSEEWAETSGISGGITAESYDPIDFTGRAVKASFTMTGLTPLQQYDVQLTYEQRPVGAAGPLTYLTETITVIPGLATEKLVEIDVVAPLGFARRLYATSVTGVQPEPTLPASKTTSTLIALGELSANGGSWTESEEAAINTFLTALETKSYAFNVKYILPFVGEDMASTLIPILDRSGFGLPTNTAFVDADASTATGLQGDGSSKILTMPFRYSELGGNPGGGFRWGCGVWGNVWNDGGTAGAAINWMWNTGNTQLYGVQPGAAAQQFHSGTLGNDANGAETRANNENWYGQANGNANRRLFLDGAFIGNNTNVVTDTNCGEFFPYLFGDNLGGTRYNASSVFLAYYTDGLMSDLDVADFHSLLAAFQTNLGR